MLTDVILDLKAQLESSRDFLSNYSYGSDAENRSIENIINNGLCFCFASEVKNRFPECNLVGSPTHVFIEYDGLFYDIQNEKGSVEKLTKYPFPLINYNLKCNLLDEFYNFNEATFYFNEALNGKHSN